MNNTIVGMGEVLWDMLPEGKQLGGAPANFAYHASQFGFDSRVISAVGDDRLGDEILESFDDKQLKYFIQRVPYPTGTVQVQLDENGIPGYEIKESGLGQYSLYSRIRNAGTPIPGDLFRIVSTA